MDIPIGSGWFTSRTQAMDADVSKTADMAANRLVGGLLFCFAGACRKKCELDPKVLYIEILIILRHAKACIGPSFGLH